MDDVADQWKSGIEEENVALKGCGCLQFGEVVNCSK